MNAKLIQIEFMSQCFDTAVLKLSVFMSGKTSYILAVIGHKSTSILWANDIIPQVYKKPHCDFRSLLMKSLDWSVVRLGREWNSTGLCIHFNKARPPSETCLILHLVAINDQTYN